MLHPAGAYRMMRLACLCSLPSLLPLPLPRTGVRPLPLRANAETALISLLPLLRLGSLTGAVGGDRGIPLVSTCPRSSHAPVVEISTTPPPPLALPSIACSISMSHCNTRLNSAYFHNSFSFKMIPVAIFGLFLIDHLQNNIFSF